MTNQKVRVCSLRKVSTKKMSFQSILENTATESASVKRSSHKSFHNIAEAYKKDRARGTVSLGPNFWNKHALTTSWLIFCYHITNVAPDH